MYNVIKFLVIIFDEKVYDVKVFSIALSYLKGVRALRGYFGPPMRSKNKSCSSQVFLY